MTSFPKVRFYAAKLQEGHQKELQQRSRDIWIIFVLSLLTNSLLIRRSASLPAPREIAT